MFNKITDYVIHLDRLEFTVIPIQEKSQLNKLYEYPLAISMAGYHFKKRYERDVNYYAVYDIFKNRRKIGVLYTKSVHGCDGDKLLLANELLYQDFVKDIDLFLRKFQLTIKHYNRIDIALDTNTNVLERFYYYYTLPHQYRLYRQSRATESINKWVKMYADDRKDVETLYIGSKKSNKKIIIYDKTEEHLTNSKPYVIDYLRLRNLSTIDTIYRFEIQLKRGALERIVQPSNEVGPNASKFIQYKKTEIDYTLLSTDGYLKALFADKIKTLFQFRRVVGKRTIPDPDLDFFDLTTTHEVKYLDDFRIRKHKPQRNERTTIKTMLFNYISTGDDFFIHTAYKLSTKFKLNDYYDKLFYDLNIDLYQKETKKQKSMGIPI